MTAGDGALHACATGLWALASAFLGVLLFLPSYPALLSLRWPSVEGTVTSSGVQHLPRSDNADVYYPRVEYSYRVGEVLHSSRRIAFGGSARSTEEEARAWAERYSVGKVVRVYYDPGAPYSSVLEPGASYEAWGAAIPAFCVALLMVCLMIAKRRQQAQER